MVFDHNWGGGSARTIPLLQNSIVFLNIIYIFNYTQFVVVPKKKHIYPFKTFT